MNLTKSLTLALGLVALPIATPVFAGPDEDGGEFMPPPPPPGGDEMGQHGPFGKRLFKKLGLTDEQKTQVGEIRKKYQPKLKELNEAVRKEHEELGKVMAAHPPIDQARAAHKKVVEAMTAVGDQRFEMMYELAGVLTQDQRNKMIEIQKEWAEKHRRHHGPGGPGGPGEP